MRGFQSGWAAAAVALTLTGGGVACCAPKVSAGTAAKIAALKELRESGVITPDQYAQRAAQLQGGAGGAGGASGTAAPPAALQISAGEQSHEIVDRQTGMVALRVTAPRGWRVQGETMHDDVSCAAPADGEIWRAESPDGAYGEEMMVGSMISYVSTGDPGGDQGMRERGCLVYGSSAGEDFLRDVWAPRMRPGAQVTKAEPAPPAVVQAVRAKAGQLPPNSEIHAGQIKLSGQDNGRPYEELVSAVVLCGQTTGSAAMGAPVRTTTCDPMLIQAERAPPGRLEDFDAHVVPQINGLDDPAYVQRIKASVPLRGQAVFQRMQARSAQENAAITARINGDRQAQLAQGQANLDMIHRTGAAIMNNERNSSNALHASSQAFARSMGDQAQYTDTKGRTFNASNQYSHTYVDGNGHAVQTNSAYPPGPGWTETQGR